MPERQVRQHLLQHSYLLYLLQSQYLLDFGQKGQRNHQTRFQQVQMQVKQCLRVLKGSVDQRYHK